jgi:phosphoribosyl-ATP pyrophosphohydrolase
MSGTGFTLSDLERIVAERASASPETSHTARLISRGIAKCAQKLGEEAVETAIAAVQEDPVEVTKEAADLLYHLMVVLRASNVELDAVLAELANRTGRSGIAEKAARPKD